MLGADAVDHLAHRLRGRVGLGAVGGLRAQHLDAGVAERRQVAVAQHLADPLQHGRGLAVRLARGIAADDRHGADEAEAVLVGDADLVLAAGRIALGAGDAHLVRAGRFDRHPGEVTDHVGQGVALRVAHLVEDLLGHGGRGDQPAGARRLGDDERSVGVTLDHGIADVGPVGHVLPVGEQAAGGLGAAFDDVAGQGAGGEAVIVGVGPAELVHQRPQRQG